MRVLAALLFGLVVSVGLHAQTPENGLSDKEVEVLRDTSFYPPQRVEAFVDFLNQRAVEIDRLAAGKRRPGREEDIHDQMEQFDSIAEELDDNLEEYGKTHKDIRKALPKLLAAAERWGTALRTPPDNEAYTVARKLALQALDDIRETAKNLVDEQKAWFAAHPTPKT